MNAESSGSEGKPPCCIVFFFLSLKTMPIRALVIRFFRSETARFRK